MNEEYIKVGRVCVSQAGHDKGCYYMIYQIIDESFILVVDGAKKTAAKPKMKRVKHIKCAPVVLEDIARKIDSGKSVYDFEIAKALEETKKAISSKGKEG